MLELQGISKTFGSKTALKDIDLTLHDGRIFGLLGTNGAGKSTLLRAASGILKPDSGCSLLNGKPVWEAPAVKADICYISDDPFFLYGATIRDMGMMQAAYYAAHDAERLKELCERFSLPLNDRISSFSKGTQKRVQICLALARHPKVLLCDETFDGLDPVMREAFRRLLAEVTVDEGMITVLAGHDQRELEDICDSVGFLHEGSLLTCGDLDTVLDGVCKVQLVLNEDTSDEVFAPLKPLRCRRQGRLCVLTMRGSRDEAEAFLKELKPVFMEWLPLSLEEIFILEMEEHGYAC